MRDCTVCPVMAWQNVGVSRAWPRLIATVMLACGVQVDTAAQRSYPSSVISRLRNPVPLSDDEIAEVL